MKDILEIKKCNNSLKINNHEKRKDTKNLKKSNGLTVVVYRTNKKKGEKN